MSLPNLSYMMSVGQLRHIQSAYEVPEHRNPDALTRHFLSPRELWSCRLRGTFAINRLRRNPFYYYVLARTRYYDAIFQAAISGGVKNVLNIGCGSDTRAYRFRQLLLAAGVTCVECDQEAAIFGKERLARARLNADHVQYMAIDLNKVGWPGLDQWLAARSGEKALVMMEGVSPYIDTAAFTAFLQLLASRLSGDSRLAYDFKLKDVADGFGGTPNGHVPFRLSDDAEDVEAFHAALGFSVAHFERGPSLVDRIVPGRRDPATSAFAEDALVQLVLPERSR
jgi:methyltransferase (TIGR00027 family)